MIEEQKIVNPLDPVEKTSFACGVCGTLKDTADEARKCAMNDTGALEISKVIKRGSAGYPLIFKASFRTGVERDFAEVVQCSSCGGTGMDMQEGGNNFPCDKCNSTGWVVSR